ncbi:MAG: retropepsin-like aspartic protease, partial [Flavobacteriaceae bacterium]
MRLSLRYLLVALLCLPLMGAAQGFYMAKGEKFQKVNFQLINNLIVIPLEVNGAKLSFILDSGVSKPILFNLSDQDSIQLNNVSEITINGLGEGNPIKALSSKGNRFKLKKIQNNNQLLYVVLDKSMNFSPSLGIPIHGIIGYDLFRDFVVDINYSNRVIRFHDPEHYKPKKNKRFITLPISVARSKSYIDGEIQLNKDQNIPVKLLVDTGSSDAIWLFKDEKKGIGIP